MVASPDVWAAILLTMFIGRAIDKRFGATSREAPVKPRTSQRVTWHPEAVRPGGRTFEAMWPEWNYD